MEINNGNSLNYNLSLASAEFWNDYHRSLHEPEEFWGELAKKLHWDKFCDKVLDNSNSPLTKWYVGGYLNACYNALDRHLLAGKGNKVALIHDSPLTNTVRKVTYQELYDTVSRLAGGLRKLGVKKGDRVVIYMPLIPEAIMSILAIVRLGAIHSFVFGGFAANELATRIEHAQPRVIIAANCGVEPNKTVRYLDILHDALDLATWKPACSVIYERDICTIDLDPRRDLKWTACLTLGEPAECVSVEANDPLYILYTSGTTGNPKGIVRPVGGHLVSLMHTMSVIYGIQPDDVCWWASDLGWVVGHSYICYGPLLYGATSVMYEGKPDRTPDPGQYFRIIEQHKVNQLFAVPTAFRVIRRVDADIKYGQKYNTGSLKTIFLAGEQCDIETKRWIESVFKVPVLNQWWQTETGSAITANCAGYGHNLNPPKYTTGLPYLGYDVKVFRPDGNEAEPNEMGRITIKLPLPPGCVATLYKNDDLFKKTYFQRFKGYYDTMDAGYKDQNNYVFVTARDDDVINVAGHRISTFSIEDTVLRHPDVADAVVFGVPESTKGQVPLCLYITKEDTIKTTSKINVEIISLVREIIGPIAAFRLVASVNAFPRTRSGKTIRKALTDFASDKQVILPSTIEDANVFKDIRRALQTLSYAMDAPEPLLTRPN